MKHIETARLRLRPLTLRDGAVFRALYGDAETMRYIGRPMRMADAAATLQATVNATRQPAGPRFFVIVERRSQYAVGLCSVRPVPPCNRRIELGIMLVHQACGRGYAREASVALINAAFRTLPIDMVWVQYRKANAAMMRLSKVLGFSNMGMRRGQCVRSMRRTTWQTKSHQPERGSSMNIVAVLDNIGRDAALRHASHAQLLSRMQEENVDAVLQDALLKPQRAALDALIGARATMYCLNQKINPPTLKKPPAKKKAPAKKKPAKKTPAKKAPAKRKR